MGLLIGFVLAVVTGAYHHACLRFLDKVTGKDRNNPGMTIVMIFIGLLGIHTSQILAWAWVYWLLWAYTSLGTLSGAFEGTWQDFVYYSGINYITLGYTQINSSGAFRLISMMQALLGFMIITWSATFIYSAWQKGFRGGQES